MSVNTFRIVFFQSNPHTFNKWLYSLICFGGPFISGFTLFFISTPARGPVYGATTTWCWIRESWVSIRLFTSYLFVWICIATSIVLNTAVGFRLFRARNKARGILNSRIQTTVTDHQTVTETNTDTDVQGSEDAPVTAVRDTQKSTPNATTVDPIPPNQKQQSSSSNPSSTKSKFWLKDPIKRAYLFTTFMFTLSVLVTWVPASITRIHSLLNRDVPYSYQVAIAAVMPLQGLWNALIFFTTSRGVIRDSMRNKCGRWVFKPIKKNQEIVRRDVAARVRVSEHTDSTDSGSDVELRRLGR
ncbi:related to G protein coupled receptor like protein [Fusarium proliferatum]|nr:related to G protein coupled receptor like protein [Fusarium proliferatum]